jgi:hypothetical protein
MMEFSRFRIPGMRAAVADTRHNRDAQVTAQAVRVSRCYWTLAYRSSMRRINGVCSKKINSNTAANRSAKEFCPDGCAAVIGSAESAGAIGSAAAGAAHPVPLVSLGGVAGIRLGLLSIAVKTVAGGSILFRRWANLDLNRCLYEVACVLGRQHLTPSWLRGVTSRFSARMAHDGHVTLCSSLFAVAGDGTQVDARAPANEASSTTKAKQENRINLADGKAMVMPGQTRKHTISPLGAIVKRPDVHRIVSPNLISKTAITGRLNA